MSVDKKVQKAMQLAGFHAQGKKKEVAKKMGEISPDRRRQLHAVQAYGEQHPSFRSREMGHYRRVINREYKESHKK